ncbi:alpha/beta hydrolase domain-containing protein [Streptococcus suis]
MEERYPSREAYVATVKAAADRLVAARYILPEDAALLVKRAETEGIRLGP